MSQTWQTPAEFYCTDVISLKIRCKYNSPRENWIPPLYQSLIEKSDLLDWGVVDGAIIGFGAANILKQIPKKIRAEITFTSFNRPKGSFSSKERDNRHPYENSLFRTQENDFENDLPPCFYVSSDGELVRGQMEKIENTRPPIAIHEQALRNLSKKVASKCETMISNDNLFSIETIQDFVSDLEQACTNHGGVFSQIKVKHGTEHPQGTLIERPVSDKKVFVGVLGKWLEPDKEKYQCVKRYGP